MSHLVSRSSLDHWDFLEREQQPPDDGVRLYEADELVDLDRLDDAVRALAEERSMIESATADAQRAAGKLRSAASAASDAAAWIAGEASRLRR